MRHFNRRAELLPEPRVRRRDHHEAVSGAKSFVGSDRRVVVADAVGRCPRRLHDASRHRECREHRVEERDVHVLAIAGAITIAEGEQRTGGPSAVPVMSMNPDSAWMMGSYPVRWWSGPVCP